MTMKKTYISPSITVVQIETETIIAGSSGTSNGMMNSLPSDPRSGGRDRFYSYDEDDLF